MGVLQLVLRYLDVFEDDRVVGTPEARLTVATHIHDLCALCIGASRDAAEVARNRGVRAARLHAVKADIARLLDDATLSAATLATRQGVTPRYIHKLFESEGTTVSKFVLGQRLVRVHRMLNDVRYAGLTIGTLAYRAGFGDLSTFNREFRRRFGVTPSDVRAARR
jgi:AraC-like DNA-binding protein